MNIRISSTIGLCIMALLSHASLAHHSTAMFDSMQCQTLTGTVRNLQWTYPHAWLWLLVPDGKGSNEIWGFEGGSPTEMNRASGWIRTTVKSGDKVSVRFHPLKDGRHGGSFAAVTLSDGQVLDISSPRPNACKLAATGSATKPKPSALAR